MKINKILPEKSLNNLWIKIKELTQKVEECFQSVSNGKSLVASAITDMGVETASDATFETIATNIGNIETGIDTSDATATATQILSGATAYVKDAKVTGTMTNQGAKSTSLNAGGSYTIPAGYHNGSGKITANSLASQTSATATAAQIASGYTAWVNGVKITGTRPAAVTSQTGSKSMTVAKRTTGQAIISFNSAFDKVPTISLALTSAYGADNYEDMTRAMTLTATSVTRTSFVLNAQNGYSNQSAICSISWAAQA